MQLNKCFTKDTLVRTLSGTKTVSDLKVGERVISYNFDTGDTDADFITKITPAGLAEEVYRICTRENEVRLSGTHEISVYRNVDKTEKIYVKDLIAGDVIFELGDEFNGVKRSYVQSVSKEEYNDVVFTVDVQKNHNYFAGDHANILI